jgi:hypothetical protein
MPPGGAEFFHVEGQTDMMKLIVAFRNFLKAPQICGYFSAKPRAASRCLGLPGLFFQL